eukprot:g10297.t1
MALDLVWFGLVMRYFLMGRAFFFISLGVFLAGQSFLIYHTEEETYEENLAVAACRAFTYLVSMGSLVSDHVKHLCVVLFLAAVCFGILAFATTLNAVKSEVETADGVQRWAQVLVSLVLDVLPKSYLYEFQSNTFFLLMLSMFIGLTSFFLLNLLADRIRRFGGSTEPSLPWPEEVEKSNTRQDHLSRLEALMMDSISKEKAKHAIARTPVKKKSLTLNAAMKMMKKGSAMSIGEGGSSDGS